MTIQEQAKLLIDKSFDSEGYLINPKSHKNINEAKSLLNSEVSFYNTYHNGKDISVCLTVIAYPNSSI